MLMPWIEQGSTGSWATSSKARVSWRTVIHIFA